MTLLEIGKNLEVTPSRMKEILEGNFVLTEEIFKATPSRIEEVLRDDSILDGENLGRFCSQ